MKAADKAATRIQARFRGYRVRKQLGALNKRNGPRRSNIAPLRKSTAGTPRPVRDEQQQQQTAATKIQAGVRGFLARRRKEALQRAAITIQTQFRAFRERRNTKKPGKYQS